MINANSLKIIFVVAITFLSFSIVGLFFQYDARLSKATEDSTAIALKHVHTFSTNIENMLHSTLGQKINSPFDLPPKLQQNVEKQLSLFVGDQYPFVYVIGQDEQGKLRYILDGSRNLAEKGEYGQKFDPESSIWKKAFESKTTQWKVQDKITGLWVTYLYPVIVNPNTTLMVAFDFSTKEFELLNQMFAPIKHYLLGISILLTFLLIISYLLVYLFYRQRKKNFIDPLTNLFNRYVLDDLYHKIKLEDIAIAIVDLDHFKQINDGYGHLVGDKVLQNIAKELQKSMRSEDVLIRYGGEEFLIFLAHEKNYSDITAIVHRIQKSISEYKMNIDGKEIQVSVSIGLNPAPHLNRSLKDAIDTADKMLYLAKTNGRNRVEVYKHRINTAIINHADQIITAIIDNRLIAHYQPIMCAKSGRVVKYEALVRMVDEMNNVRSPSEFLPFIKKTMAYRAMSKTMLANVFEAINKYQIEVNINFDTGDFFDETLYELIYQIIAQHRNIAPMLTIELLEDQEVTDIEAISKRIENLRSLGVKIAIDDFGSGYSTFSYLLGIKPDFLKIDGTLIRNIGKEDHAENVIASIVNICATLGILTVAEYVEDEEKIECLKRLNVDFLQGYAIGKPMVLDTRKNMILYLEE